MSPQYLVTYNTVNEDLSGQNFSCTSFYDPAMQLSRARHSITRLQKNLMKKVKRKNEVIFQIKILFSDVYTLPSPLAYLLKDISNDNIKAFTTVNQKQNGF